MIVKAREDFSFSDKIPNFSETMELCINFLWDFELPK